MRQLDYSSKFAVLSAFKAQLKKSTFPKKLFESKFSSFLNDVVLDSPEKKHLLDEYIDVFNVISESASDTKGFKRVKKKLEKAMPVQKTENGVESPKKDKKNKQDKKNR